MIAVVGGTGRLGHIVVQRLRSAGEEVVVVRRRPPEPAGRMTDTTDPAVPHLTADVRDVAAVRAALQGVSVCVSAFHGVAPTGDGSPATVDWMGNRNLVDAAAEAGAAVVMLSVVGAGPDSPMELSRMKWRAEEYLRASGVPWTVVRATAFAELWKEILQSTAGRSGRLQVFGRGENPINFVSVADVATAVVHAVTDAGLRGRTITVAGPEDVTLNDFAARLADGRPPRHVPRAGLVAMSLVARPVRPALARTARMALAMDTADLAVAAAPDNAAYPWLPCTPIW